MKARSSRRQARCSARNLRQIGPLLGEYMFKFADLSGEPLRSGVGVKDGVGDVTPESLDDPGPVTGLRPVATGPETLGGARIAADLPSQFLRRP